MVTFCRRVGMRHKNFFMHLRCHMSRYMLVKMHVSYLGKKMRKQSTVQGASRQDSWRWTLAMAKISSSKFPWRSHGTFRSYRGSNGFTWVRNLWNIWHGTKMGTDTILTSWYIHPMVNHGEPVIGLIVRKLKRLTCTCCLGNLWVQSLWDVTYPIHLLDHIC